MRRNVVNGVNGLGFTMIVLPARSAGAIFQTAKRIGKFLAGWRVKLISLATLLRFEALPGDYRCSLAFQLSVTNRFNR